MFSLSKIFKLTNLFGCRPERNEPTTGLKSDQVKRLQADLRELGFVINDDEGVLGSSTQQAMAVLWKSLGFPSEPAPDGHLPRVAAALAETLRRTPSEEARRALRGRLQGRTRPAGRDRTPQPLRVRGRVTGADGVARAGLHVRAFDRDMRGEEPLGEAVTDARGAYQIEYRPEQFRRAEKDSADLVVRVYGLEPEALAESRIIFNARPVETVDLVIEAREGGLSEYEKLAAELAPLLDGVAPAELGEKDVAFLAGETGVSSVHIAFYSTAHRHAATTRVVAEAFYGLFRQDLPTALPALLSKSPRILQDALAASVRTYIVPEILEKDIGIIVDALHDQAGRHILSAGEGSPGDLLSAAGLSSEEQEAFLKAYVSRQGPIEEFWKSIQNTLLGAKTEELQRTLQVGILTGNNAALVRALREKSVRSPRDLAGLGVAELRKTIASSKEALAGIPSLDADESAEQKATRAAEEMISLLNVAIPTTVLAANLEKAPPDALRHDVARFLANAPSLELRDENVDRFIEREGEGVFDGVQDRQATTAQLKRFQRVMRVVPRYEHMEALLSEGLDSARAVTSLSEAAFTEIFSATVGGPTQARAYYKKAQQVTDSVSAVATAVLQSVTDVAPAVMGKASQGLKTAPNFTSLFGSFGLCECKDCRSVYSPAAYLVDLLQFINPKSGAKPLDVLHQRRPDLKHIPLTCENTNTTLPYVDLVNEILEFYVVHGHLTENAARDTTGMTAKELDVNPQYTIEAAYNKLKVDASAPGLPFHRPLEVSRQYLEHLGVPRYVVLRTVQDNNAPSETDVLNESLKISAAEGDILTGADLRPLHKFYGYMLIQAVTVNDEGTVGQEPWESNIVRVPEFLKRTGTVYEELTDLLASRFLNGQAPFMVLQEAGDVPTCDLTKTSILNFTTARMKRAHRFLRLARKLDYALPALDLALPALQETDITTGLLGKLAQVKALETELKQPLPVLLSLWSRIPTQGKDPLYQKLFQNKAVLNPVDPDFDLNANGTALLATDKKLSEKSAALLSAFRLTDADLSALRSHAGLEAAAAPLTLDNLSALYRRAALARALNLKVKDFLAWLALSGADPFQPGAPASTVDFVRRVREAQASAFSVARLNYLYRHDTSSAEAPTSAEIDGVMQGLREGLQRVIQETTPLPDPTGETLRAKLPLVLEPALVDAAMGVIDGAAEPADKAGFIDLHFAVFMDPQEAKNDLLPLPPADPEDPEERKQNNRAFVLERLLAHLRRVQSRDLVLQTLGEDLALESAAAELLLESLLHSSADSAQPALSDFLALADPDAPTDSAGVSYRRLHKAALLITGFEITPKELAYLAGHPADFHSFDLNALPLEPGGFTPDLFIQWERLRDLFALRARWPQHEADLIDVFDASSLAEALEALEQASGWDPAEVEFLAGPGGFDLGAGDLKSETKLLRLRDCIALSRRLGLSCERIFAWVQTEPDAVGADEIVNAAKARHDAEQWPSIAKPLNDALRERRRTALVSYILTRDAVAAKNISNVNQLFEYFLIDVEMAACMDTSRIKQALSSVQLFIQRCLMNLEAGVAPSSVDADQWEWMKNYRVWEANRKVFLYPENWLEPELRDDKTPFFGELESQLLQGDMAEDTAEAAFLAYLEKLHDVAKLEICGLFTQDETVDGETTYIVHVFGRTPDMPHIYYYRQLVGGSLWTPWEKLEIDIDGDHLIPVVYNRRLYLFWTTFEEKPEKERALDAPFIQSIEHWQWSLAHAEWNQVHKEWKTAKELYDGWVSRVDTAVGFREDAGAWSDEEIAAFKQKMLDLGPSDPGEEPVEPTEPPRVIDPPLSRWAIKLSWSEYNQGKWSPRRTATETVTSSFLYRRLSDYVEGLGLGGALVLGGINQGVDLGTPETIVDVRLAPPEDHFFRARVEAASGDLLVDVYRRYEYEYTILDFSLKVGHQGYEKLGQFRLFCGAKVKALSQGTTEDFDGFRRPNGADNYFMGFRDEDPKALTFTSGGEKLSVLLSIPDQADEYTILNEHKSANFALKPPFQRFFYQDKLKTYMASHRLDVPRSVLTDRSKSVLIVPAVKDDALVDTVRASAPHSVGFSRAFDGRARQGRSMRAAPRAEEIGGGSYVRPSGGMVLAEAAQPLALFSELSELGGTGGVNGPWQHKQSFLKFDTFFHPHACAFLKKLYRKGLPGLLDRKTQQLDNDKADLQKNVFKHLYWPAEIVHWEYPREDVDFGGGAYGTYNWELFFHVPLLIALSLSKNQRFEEAQTWFHYIFNPTSNSTEPSPARYWNTLPFFENADPEKDQIQNLLAVLSSTDPTLKSLREQVEQQIRQWREDPFNPHLIARLRITAYQKNVVMKYIDNLVQWGDQLFSQDTLESINEATLLYVLAFSILGPRPIEIASPLNIEPKTYDELKKEGLDEFSNALVAFENEFPYTPPSSLMVYYARKKTFSPARYKGSAASAAVKTAPETLYFAIPKNDQLLAYWDTVEDRLFKIRHCMNIEGVVRELPLFEPPIDPALLVRAKAAGLSISSVLSDLNGPLPCYRFNHSLQKALELCGELKSLGGTLLSALEKKDAEGLSILRAGHESAILSAVREVKKRQIDEAEQVIEGLRKSKSVAEARCDFYRDIERISGYEQEHMDALATAHVFSDISQGVAAGASGAHIVPNFTLGQSGWAASPVVKSMFGGTNMGHALEAIAKRLGMVSAQFSHDATMASIRGGYDRRWQEWKQQEKVINKELEQIDKQLLAAEIRLDIAEKDLTNHEKQIENAAAVEDFLRNKYTRDELYGWMQGQVAKVFFQAYKLTYDLAKRAEKAYRFELGLKDSSFIQFGHWEDLRKGLLCGEKLYLDLKRMEAAYLDQNRREYELIKSVSLAAVDPFALLTLKETGRCQFDLPEALFDLDYPGHYMRRLKNVSLTIPCVAGPYTGVHCTLTLLKNEVRLDANALQNYPKDAQNDDPRFAVNFAALQSIATSHAQNDAGMFEVNFRDERYLPFEGAGTVSRWRLDLPKATNAFDLNTVSDVILQLRYTAREGGDLLRSKALAAAQPPEPAQPLPSAPPLQAQAGQWRLLSARHEFANDWHRFLHPVETKTSHALALSLTRGHFPFGVRDISVTAVQFFWKLKPGAAFADTDTLSYQLQTPSGETAPADSNPNPAFQRGPFPGVLFANHPLPNNAEEPGGAPWVLTVPESAVQSLSNKNALRKSVTISGQQRFRLNAEAVEDLWILVRYSA